MSNRIKLLAMLVWSGLVVIAPFQAAGEDADGVLDEIRQLALQADPDMSALEQKVQLWAELQREALAERSDWQELQAKGPSVLGELKALMKAKAPAADNGEIPRDDLA